MKDNQPSLGERLVEYSWMDRRADDVEKNRGHGRIEKRSLRVFQVPADAPLPGFPSARQMMMVIRERSTLAGKAIGDPDITFAITSLSRQQAKPRHLDRKPAARQRDHFAVLLAELRERRGQRLGRLTADRVDARRQVARGVGEAVVGVEFARRIAPVAAVEALLVADLEMLSPLYRFRRSESLGRGKP